jgi:hypothetical protein
VTAGVLAGGEVTLYVLVLYLLGGIPDELHAALVKVRTRLFASSRSA